MLNYIWGGLIILSVTFATLQDVSDELTNRWQNGREFPIEILYLDEDSRELSLRIAIQKSDSQHQGLWIPGKKFDRITININANLPQHWQDVAQHQAPEKQTVELIVTQPPNKHGLARITLPEVHFVKLKAVTNAAFDMATFAVELALGLAGLMALWLGLMRIAEKSGLVNSLVQLVRPLMNFLFPDIPKDHPVLGTISLNLTANILGLGNAATPMGIRAMQQLQELNGKKDEATDSMCMFLALNTSSVQLLPPVTLIALLGAQVSELFFAILLATICSTLAGFFAARTFARRRSSMLRN
ncbi:MAG: nucleoside recognition protein [Gammaproteobacteria bacterium]|nr:nucleoside recognition protein [Gammaproteobacteria bacterium]